MNDRLSIVIVCYNERDFIRESLSSAVDKGQVILVCNGPEKYQDIAKEYGVRYFETNDSRLPAARNFGINKTETPYHIVLDADDKLLSTPDEAFKLMDADPTLGVVYGNYQRFGNRTGQMIPNVNIRWEDFLQNNQLFASSLVKKEAWQSVGGYWEDCWYAEDWDYWGRLMKRLWKFQYINHDFCEHRIRRDSKWRKERRAGLKDKGRELVVGHIRQDAGL